MKNLKKNLNQSLKILFSYFFLIALKPAFSSDVIIEIQGNNFTDADVILSLLEDKPAEIDNKYSNYIIKELNNSKLFENVEVEINENKYIIIVKEYSNIKKVSYVNNDRLKDDELDLIMQQLEITNLDPIKINLFIQETKLIYESFGFNNIKINYEKSINKDSNTANVVFKFDEGKITKINQIFFEGNNLIDSQELRNKIKSKTKSLTNIFANNNYKKNVLKRDEVLVTKLYKNRGYVDAKITTKVEFLKNNRVNIYFKINEGNIYNFSSIKLNDSNKILSKKILNQINENISEQLIEDKTFSLDKINKLKENIADLIILNEIKFFEIKITDNISENNVDIVFEIISVSPVYTNQINIFGNSRTFDYVIRRELEVVEGDAIYSTQINEMRNKLLSLDLFKSVNITQESIENNLVNINITVEEKQTGTFNAGVSAGSLDGYAILGGLKENNFYGTGRSLEFLINTSEDRRTLTFITSDRLASLDNGKINYNINYKEQDLSKSSSYKLNTFNTGVGISYKVNKNLYNNLGLEYLIKDYEITNESTVSSAIASSSGENVSFLITNNLRYSTLNSGFISREGQSLNFNNTLETPTSSSNGFLRNTLTYKIFNNIDNKNILSLQARVGNIISLNNNDILTDDKFSLGGRWLRGFDNFGAGPRNSRTSYVGGNNLAVMKLDFSREITDDSNFPIFINVFNDYGLLWQNKTKPTLDDNDLRSSAGFGIKYYSPIGPIGFSWGYPLIDKEYDIKRMFLFSIGNID